MKKFLITLTLVLSFLNIIAADITTISNAFKEGKAELLHDSMAQEVDMRIPGISMKFDANKAVTSLTTFFRHNKPTNFTVLHHADKKEDGVFVARLTTSSDEVYRVIITYRSENNKALIQSIKIE